MAVAFFTDLRHFEQRTAAAQQCSNGQAPEIEAFYHEVLAERTVIYLGAACTELLNTMKGQQADLPMPITRVRVAFDTPIFHEPGSGNACLLDASFITDAYRFNNTHRYPPI
jgi:hypothetical protein